MGRQILSLGACAAAVQSAVKDMERGRWAERLRAKDASLWKTDPKAQAAIRNRLGWLDLPSLMAGEAKNLSAFASEIAAAGFSHVVLLGMGGSSLCPEVLGRTFGAKKGFPALFVLDTTDPAAIQETADKIVLEKTLFIVASKSGGTIEVSSLFRHFFAQVQRVKGDKAGENFVAVTDPGTALEALAGEKGFRRTFTSRADVGGRYSALTFFGLVPAALLGLDMKDWLARAARMADPCSAQDDVAENPGLSLGAAMGALAKAGRDKVTFFMSPEIAVFGMWLEQLIAESTGKEGRGVVPVEGEEPGSPESYGDDRVFVYLKLAGSRDKTLDPRVDALEKAGHPVVRITLDDALDLAGEFFRWEVATVAAGGVLGINPFDEPNVTESKTNTQKLLEKFQSSGKWPGEPPLWEEDGVRLWADPRTAERLLPLKGKGSLTEALARHWAQARPGDYVALMAYVAQTEALHAALQSWREEVRRRTRAATTLGYGPRFLHSTGQLHKGGADNGLFLQITAADGRDIPIPGEKYGFSVLKGAQALGDFQALKDHGRRVVRLHFDALSPQALDRFRGLPSRVKTPA